MSMMINHPMYSSTMIPTDQESDSPERSFGTYDSVYPHFYSSHPHVYHEYPHPSKLEAFDYNYWPAPPPPATSTQNLLNNPPNVVVDAICPGDPSNQSMENLIPISSVNLSQFNSTYHQAIYQPPSSSAAQDCSTWMATHEYPSIHSNLTPPSSSSSSSYRHYSGNQFYDTPPGQWTTGTSSTIVPIKFESPYSPTFYGENAENFNPTDESNQCSQGSSLTPVPPRNPLNGKTRTRDKYRIVYTDKQRYELENEFTNSQYISIPRKAALSLSLALSERQIKIWFQNRRAKERKLNKKRQEMSTRSSSHSHDADSTSDTPLENPHYYSKFS